MNGLRESSTFVITSLPPSSSATTPKACGPTLQGGKDRQTDRQTDRGRQRNRRLCKNEFSASIFCLPQSKEKSPRNNEKSIGWPENIIFQKPLRQSWFRRNFLRNETTTTGTLSSRWLFQISAQQRCREKRSKNKNQIKKHSARLPWQPLDRRVKTREAQNLGMPIFPKFCRAVRDSAFPVVPGICLIKK